MRIVRTRKAAYWFEPQGRYVAKDNGTPIKPITFYEGFGCRVSKCPYRNMTCNKCKLKIR